MEHRLKKIILMSVLVYAIIGLSCARSVRRNLLIVRSSSFEGPNDPMVTLGNNKLNIPTTGRGLYAVAIKKGIFKNVTRALYIGVLKPHTFQSQFMKMDNFFEKNKQWGAYVFTLFTIGTTHEKPTLKLLRNGILANEFTEVADILRKYDMVKFIGLAHGCRQPYIMIRDVSTGVTKEKTGFLGGKMTSKLIVN